MKTIGLIGGMSWESTVTYYQAINTAVKERLGGLHSAKCLLYSVDFDEIAAYQANNEWEKAAHRLADIAMRLEQAGAEMILICTNTMHKVVSQVQSVVAVPILHIADAVIEALNYQDMTTVGLLGTNFTMVEGFYTARLAQQGLKVLVPEEEDRKYIDNAIFNELCQGVFQEETKQRFLKIIDGLTAQGAQGIVLGCTEIPLLIRQEDTEVPLFNTSCIHAESAVNLALEE